MNIAGDDVHRPVILPTRIAPADEGAQKRQPNDDADGDKEPEEHLTLHATGDLPAQRLMPPPQPLTFRL